MPQTIYALLDHNARRWWYHIELRKRGKVAEARRRERQSIRENVRTLHQALENGGSSQSAATAGPSTCPSGTPSTAPTLASNNPFPSAVSSSASPS